MQYCCCCGGRQHSRNSRTLHGQGSTPGPDIGKVQCGPNCLCVSVSHLKLRIVAAPYKVLVGLTWVNMCEHPGQGLAGSSVRVFALNVKIETLGEGCS